MRWRWWIVTCALLAAGAARAQQEIRLDGFQRIGEVEPQNSCETAQDIGKLTRAVTFVGRLAPGDVEFVRFSSEPGVRIELSYTSSRDSQQTLTDPLLGVLGSDCQPLQLQDISDPPGALLRAPQDGVVIAALTAGEDREFAGAHAQRGNYRLVLAEHGDPIQEIRGRLLDAQTGAPLQGSVFFQKCEGEVTPCFTQGTVQTGTDGVFRILASAPFPRPFLLRSGHYTIGIDVPNYTGPRLTGLFVPNAPIADLGDFRLPRNPIALELVQGCADANPTKLWCSLRVRVTNHTDAPLDALAWATASASSGRGSWQFEIGRLPSTRALVRHPLRLAARASRELEFQLPQLPSSEFFSQCTTIHIGRNPRPFYGVEAGAVFCLESGQEQRRAEQPIGEGN